MPLKYSCFISYRAGKHQLAEAIVKDLFEALSNEVELVLEEDVSEVYFDDKRLKGGDFFNQELAMALCHSVCMIVVFTPQYFSRTQTYCAREYWAMEQIEKKRLALLAADKKTHGLIIPVIVRGEKRLPSQIRTTRKFYDFEAFRQGDQKITRPRGYFEAIKDIAEYISDRYYELSALKEDPCELCATFRLPGTEDIEEWLETIIEDQAKSAK